MSHLAELGEQVQTEVVETVAHELRLDMADEQVPGIRRRYAFVTGMQRFMQRVGTFPNVYTPLIRNPSGLGYMLGNTPIEVGDILNIKMKDQVMEFSVHPRSVDIGRSKETFAGKFLSTQHGFICEDVPLESPALFIGSLRFLSSNHI